MVRKHKWLGKTAQPIFHHSLHSLSSFTTIFIPYLIVLGPTCSPGVTWWGFNHQGHPPTTNSSKTESTKGSGHWSSKSLAIIQGFGFGFGFVLLADRSTTKEEYVASGFIFRYFMQLPYQWHRTEFTETTPSFRFQLQAFVGEAPWKIHVFHIQMSGFSAVSKSKVGKKGGQQKAWRGGDRWWRMNTKKYNMMLQENDLR